MQYISVSCSPLPWQYLLTFRMLEAMAGIPWRIFANRSWMQTWFFCLTCRKREIARNEYMLPLKPQDNLSAPWNLQFCKSSNSAISHATFSKITRLLLKLGPKGTWKQSSRTERLTFSMSLAYTGWVFGFPLWDYHSRHSMRNRKKEKNTLD